MCDYCSWIDQILARIKTAAEPAKKNRRTYVDPVIVVHGGAGKIPRNIRNRMLFNVKKAAIESYSGLINGDKAIDAAERAICYMECEAFFNCSRGGSLNVNNEIVMDAAIMTRNNAGCVGDVRDIEHPISLARTVLEKTDHVLIVEGGARKLALDHGFPILQPGALNVQESVTFDEYEGAIPGINETASEDDRMKSLSCDSDCFIKRSIDEEESSPYYMPSDSSEFLDEPFYLQVGAVGAVAYDRKRRLVSATSTAGDPGKPIGLISATGTVIGCGIYTDERGSASVSGSDTSIYRFAPARKIIQKLHNDVSIEDSVRTVLDDFENETGDFDIGTVVVNAIGEPYVSFKSVHFPWAYCKNGYVYYGVAQNEKNREKVDILERPLDCMCISSSDEDL